MSAVDSFESDHHCPLSATASALPLSASTSQSTRTAAMSQHQDGVDSEEMEDEVEWMLGFAETPRRATDLLRHRFPSKVGGRPAWLDPVHLPTREQLTCGLTGQQLQFLLQVYAPTDANPEAFHRTVYVFISPEGDKLAHTGAVRAFRCQLPRANPYYSFEPPGPADVLPASLPAAEMELSLERDPWRVVEAERMQAGPSGQQQQQQQQQYEGCPDSPQQLKELELVVEPEPHESEDESDQAAVQRMMQEYQARTAQEGELDEDELPSDLVQDIEDAAGRDRQCFADFQARTARAPQQCLRYCFQDGASAMWPSPLNMPSPADIPSCPQCGGPRKFEFQIMPQLLTFLELDEEDPHSPDWGCIAVYTCAASCDMRHPTQEPGGAESAYVEEFVWVQGS